VDEEPPFSQNDGMVRNFSFCLAHML
jgi:hypothetical protein